MATAPKLALHALPPECTVSTEAIESSERGDSLARKRFQRGHVFLIGDTWFGKYREDVIEAEGNTRRKQVTVTLGNKKDIPTKPLAKRRMELLLTRINSTDYRPGRFAKMDEFATIWQEHILVGSKPSSIRSAKSHLNVHILAHFGKRGLDEIGVQAQQFFVTKLAQANLSRKMILNVLSTLASILQTAQGWGYVCQMVDYKRLTIPTEEVQTEARFFTLEEVGKIIAAAREPYKTMFWLLAMTGMRAGEMLGLQWADIDFEKGLLNIRRSAWYGRIQTTKNRNSEAIIPLPGILAATLRTFREQWKSNPDGFLFVTRNRRPPSSNKVVEYGLWPVLDLLAIPRCGLHAFRHTHTSLLLDTGATPKVVQEQLRHADPRITLGVYAHVLGAAHREAVEKVASVVFQSVPKAREETKYIQ
jgi:integrase